MVTDRSMARMRHHIVPCSVLDGFSENPLKRNSPVYVYDKERNETRFQLTKDTAFLHDFYAVRLQDWSLDYGLEKFLGSEIESPAVAAIRKASECRALERPEFAAIARYLAVQSVRWLGYSERMSDMTAAAWLETLETLLGNETSAAMNIALWREEGLVRGRVDPKYAVEYFGRGDVRKSVLDHFDVKGHAVRSVLDPKTELGWVSIPDLLARFDKKFVFAPGNSRFVCSDAPVVRWVPWSSSANPWYAAKGLKVLCPLSKSLSLELSDPWPRMAPTEKIFVAKGEYVLWTNAMVASRCDRYVVAGDPETLAAALRLSPETCSVTPYAGKR